MTQLKIRQIIGKNAISMDQGTVLYQLILKEFSDNKNTEFEIIIDFEDVNVISSPFFNASISYLLKDYPIEYCQKHISFKNIKEETRNILNLSIQNAISFYSSQ